MEHVDCLFGSGVVSVLKSKPLDDSSRLNLVCVNPEKLCYCAGLLGRQQALPQLDFA